MERYLVHAPLIFSVYHFHRQFLRADFTLTEL